MSSVPLPPSNEDKLKIELSLVDAHDLEDATQEAWLAHVEGKSPSQAVKRFRMRQERYRQTHILETDLKPAG